MKNASKSQFAAINILCSKLNCILCCLYGNCVFSSLCTLYKNMFAISLMILLPVASLYYHGCCMFCTSELAVPLLSPMCVHFFICISLTSSIATCPHFSSLLCDVVLCMFSLFFIISFICIVQHMHLILIVVLCFTTQSIIVTDETYVFSEQDTLTTHIALTSNETLLSVNISVPLHMHYIYQTTDNGHCAIEAI